MSQRGQIPSLFYFLLSLLLILISHSPTTTAKSTSDPTPAEGLIHNAWRLLTTKHPTIELWTISIEARIGPITDPADFSPEITLAGRVYIDNDPTLISLTSNAAERFDIADAQVDEGLGHAFDEVWAVYALSELIGLLDAVALLRSQLEERGPWDGVSINRWREGDLSDQVYYLFSRIVEGEMRNWVVGCGDKVAREHTLHAEDEEYWRNVLGAGRSGSLGLGEGGRWGANSTISEVV